SSFGRTGRMRHITVAYKCEHRPDGRWAPGFELTLVDSGEYKTPRKFSAVDSNLTLPTKEEAEAASDATAREWCADNYPGWEVEAAERRFEALHGASGSCK
ncbi:MAG: hypothetical protein WBE69_08955, partial [Candidatus Binataceae bacterium]